MLHRRLIAFGALPLLLVALPGCERDTSPRFSNFNYAEYLATVETSEDLRLPPLQQCLAHIREGDRFVCVVERDDEFTLMYVNGTDDVYDLHGSIHFTSDNYFRISRDARGSPARPALRVSKLFPQGREGIFADCVGYNEHVIRVRIDGEVQYYDWDLNRRDSPPLSGIECTIFAE